MHNNVITLSNITKTYQIGGEQLTVLSIPSLAVQEREWLSITGQSGSGKTTLLHILGCLDLPTTGTYTLNGTTTTSLTPTALSILRNKTLGFIFQRFNLLPTLTAAENIALPLRYAGLDAETITQRLDEMFALIHLNERRNHYPHQLSGGQQQRVAIARALITKPSVILADEPTGSLDSATGKEILTFLKNLHEAYNITVVLITHDAEVASQGTRTVHIKDGRIFSDTATQKL